METKLVVIDGNSILYREFFALSTALKNSQGQPTNAVFGFANQIIKIINELKPTHMVVAFDVSKKTFRNDIFEGYKANRKPMPEELRLQLEPLRQMLKLMNITYLEKQGLEGDDIVGTIAKRFNVPTIIITGDRDTFQLIDETTVVYRNKKGLTDLQKLGETEIKELFGVEPKQLVYVKALAGDSSDNILGVSGVGEKTALNLIGQYGDLDGVYANIENIKGSLKEKLQKDKDMAYISLQLARINTNVDIKCELDDLTFDFPFGAEVLRFFQDNNFKTLLKKTELFASECEAVEEERDKFLGTNIIDVATHSGLEYLVKEASNTQNIGIFESEDSWNVCFGGDEYTLKKNRDLLGNCISDEEFLVALKSIFESKMIEKVVFNSKQFMHKLDRLGIGLSNYSDIMVAKHIVDGKTVKDEKDFFDDIDFDKKFPAKSLLVGRTQLFSQLKNHGMMKLYQEIELPMTQVLFDMEKTGVKVDLERLGELEKKYQTELEELTQKIYREAGHEFNINSPKQTGEVLYDELRLKKSKKKSTAIEELEEIEDRHPIVALIIRHRKVSKFLSNFLIGMRAHIDKEGLIHTQFNQTMTQTGRLSSSEPNLQNIPVRGEESRDIRSIFIPREKANVLIDADYSQIELRILAHFSQDELLIQAFNNNEDIHTQTACAVFGVGKDLVTPEMRRQAKVVNFGVNYGISDFGLAKDLKIPPYEARKYIENYYLAHPKIKEFMESSIKKAKETGEVSTLFNRIRKMPEIGSNNYLIRSRAERAAQNMPLQGTAADIVKIAMVAVSKELEERGFKAKLIMQVHDELLVDCPLSEVEEVKILLEKCMKNAARLLIPLDVDVTVCSRWSEGH